MLMGLQYFLGSTLSNLGGFCQFREQLLYLILKLNNVNVANHNAKASPFHGTDFVLLINAQNIKWFGVLTYEPISIESIFRNHSLSFPERPHSHALVYRK